MKVGVVDTLEMIDVDHQYPIAFSVVVMTAMVCYQPGFQTRGQSMQSLFGEHSCEEIPLRLLTDFAQLCLKKDGQAQGFMKAFFWREGPHVFGVLNHAGQFFHTLSLQIENGLG